MELEAYSEVISSLYEAAADVGDWPTAISALTKTYDAGGAFICSTTQRGRVLSSSDNLLEINETYLREKWYLLDNRFLGVPRMMSHGVTVDDDFMTEEDARRSAFYQDFVLKNGFRWWSGLAIPTADDVWCLSSQRSPAQGRFAPHDQEKLKSFVPHLSRAITLHGVLQRSRSKAMLDVLQALDVPAFALAANKRVLAHNAPARILLGHGIDIVSDHLATPVPTDAALLDKLIADAVSPLAFQSKGGHIAPISRANRRPLIVSAITLPRSARSSFVQLAALILINDPDAKPKTSQQAMEQLFGLSPAEAKVAAAMAQGHALKDIADTLGLTESTTRQYAKQVLTKSSTHRQGEFIALVGRLLRNITRS